MKLTSDRCVDCGRQTDYAGLRGGDWVPVCRSDCPDDCCDGSTKGRDEMYQANKRLDELDRGNKAYAGAGRTEIDWLIKTARRAIDALGKIEAAAVVGVSNVAGFALGEIEESAGK